MVETYAAMHVPETLPAIVSPFISLLGLLFGKIPAPRRLVEGMTKLAWCVLVDALDVLPT